MAPNLRKRVWYQRYLGTDDVDVTSSYGVLFRKSSTDRFRRPHVNHGVSGGKCSSGSRRNWKRSARRCGSHDSESGSSSLSDDEIRSGEIKMEVEDTKDFPRKNTVPVSNCVTAKCQGRMLMREWLEANANGGCMSGLKWLDKDLGLVQIAWKHGSRAGWNRSDVEVFESWALHTGKFNPKKSDCKRWKANFRCALNSLPDVVEMKEKCNTRSRNPYKVYRLLPPHKVAKQKKLTSSDGYILPQQLSPAYNNESDVIIKEEPVDEDEDDVEEEESDFTNLELLQQNEPANNDDNPSGECKGNEEMADFQNAVKTTTQRINRINEPFCFQTTLHVPDVHQNLDITTQQLLTTANSIRHYDHSYANSFEHLNEEQKTDGEQQPDLSDGHDLMSTINEELAKFCSSNFGVDFWNEETEICATKFILQDVMDSSDLDGFLLQ